MIASVQRCRYLRWFRRIAQGSVEVQHGIESACCANPGVDLLAYRLTFR